MLLIQKTIAENQLLKDCLKGKQQAQKEFYVRFASKMLGACARYIPDRMEAEHVMVGAMVKAFEKLKQFKGEGSLEGWVRRIVINECLMYIRKNRMMSLEVDYVNDPSSIDFELIESSMATEDLLRIIQELPVGYRTVFNLYAIEGYNHAEIAELLDVNESTSKSQLSRARKLLQTKLMALQEDERIIRKENG
ncbi:RNA polymerase sigma factor [Marinoscillum sp. MHG1-6]|uniref:RNA polymerase sigma factor n=1 Tax=Marinoscillum sp. MHG1-6 TaxID=2959627 RepID=UPI00215704FD|nr:sigma-70 family RNA polymerase sigma factor [Marinoscillum sp. MHG1-6]